MNTGNMEQTKSVPMQMTLKKMVILVITAEEAHAGGSCPTYQLSWMCLQRENQCTRRMTQAVTDKPITPLNIQRCILSRAMRSMKQDIEHLDRVVVVV